MNFSVLNNLRLVKGYGVAIGLLAFECCIKETSTASFEVSTDKQKAAGNPAAFY
jgi:hypothetical protein